MNEVAYTLDVGVALVFAWAGAAKLRRPRRTQRGLARLGVPAPLARVVPLAEIGLALVLVVAPRAGVLAAALLAAFTLVLARADDGVGCACFGGASTDPVSTVHLVRNALLAAAALVGATSSPTTPDVASVAVVAGCAALAALALALADLGRRTGAIVRVELP